MRIPKRFVSLHNALVLFAASLAGACSGPSPFEVNGPATGTFSIRIGQDIDIHMQTIGPGEFASPPSLAGSAIAFLGVGPGPTDPGGVTQVFRFKAVNAGLSIVTFQTAGGAPNLPHATVVDTVAVQCFAVPPSCQ